LTRSEGDNLTVTFLVVVGGLFQKIDLLIME
jgi:hypothetical protein